MGCHRSGTSALTHVLHLQGATLPKTLMKSQPDNPDGFWESQPIVQFNDSLLRSADRTWFDPRPIEAKWFKDPSKRLHRIDQAKKLIAQEFPEGDLLVLKDPRICRLLPIWLTALEQSEIDVSVLLILRNPLEVAASLNARNQLDRVQSNLLWLEHTLAAEKQTRHLPRAFIDFDSLLDDWRSELIEVSDAIHFDSIDLNGSLADEIDSTLSKAKKHHSFTTNTVLRDDLLPAVLKESWVACQSRPIANNMVFESLYQNYQDLAKNLKFISPMEKQNNPETNKNLNTAESSGKLVKTLRANVHKSHRHIILHYHLFKNAGTSIDKTLKDNFKDGWHEHEGPSSGWKSDDVAAYLEQNRHIKVLSSHTALLPAPMLPNTTIYPIIFIRHPIDRVRSIYEFERKQIAETEGAIKAKELDIAGYIEWRLGRKGDRTIRNFQAYRLSHAIDNLVSGCHKSEEVRALEALASLPFFGVVEHFDVSIQRLQKYLKPIFPSIELKSAKLNITRDVETTLDERLLEFRSTIGMDLYSSLYNSNLLDLKIYEKFTKI